MNDDTLARCPAKAPTPLRVTSPSGARMIIDGKSVLNFGGSCYLGLSSEPAIVQAGLDALRMQGATGTISRHYGIASASNLEVEAIAADFFSVERAMYFATGYLFGLIALAGLADDYDVVLLDEHSHYNLRDGARAAGKPIRTFRHCDAADLERVVDDVTRSGARPLVTTDGMFATLGTISPLAAYRRILAEHAAWLVVDESHSLGALGANGRGAVELEGVTGDRILTGGSLGKALCAYGGLALGDAATIDRLWRTPAARGTAGGMTSGAAMAAASMVHVRHHPERIAKLRDNVCYLRSGLQKLGLPIAASTAPIAAFTVGSAHDMQALQARLMDQAIFVSYSTYVGSGPEGIIRCAAFADHERADFDRLFDALAMR